MLAVKIVQLQRCEVDLIEAAHVDIDFVRIGARDVERRDSTLRTEVMLRDAGVEGISREISLGRQHAEILARDDPVQVTLPGADRAIALRSELEDAGHLECDASAMTAASINARFVRRVAHRASLRVRRSLVARSLVEQRCISAARRATIVRFPTITIERLRIIADRAASAPQALTMLPNRRNQLMPVRRAAIPTTGPRGAIPGAITDTSLAQKRGSGGSAMPGLFS